MTEKRTALTPVISTGSNVQYQLQLIYNITKRTKDSVTMDIDIRVHYLREWSSNGAWVRIDDSRRCLNPRHIRGHYDWYASTQSTTRTPKSVWLKGKTFKTTPDSVSVSAKVGFSNQFWAEGSYHYQHISIPIPKYENTKPQSPNKPPVGFEEGLPKEYVTITTPKYFKDEIHFKWTEAPLADRYDVEGYKLVKGEWQYISQYSTMQLSSSYILRVAKPGEQFRMTIYPMYDGERGEASHSEIITRNTPPHNANLLTNQSPVQSTDYIELDEASVNKPEHHITYGLRILNQQKEIIKELSFQPSPRFEDVYRDLNGMDVYIQWAVNDGFDQTDWSEPKMITIGKKYELLAQLEVNREVFEEGLIIDVPNVLLDGRPMHNVNESIYINYTIEKDRVLKEGTFAPRFHRYVGQIRNLQLKGLWEELLLSEPDLQTNHDYKDAQINIEVSHHRGRFQKTYSKIILHNPQPRVNRAFQAVEGERYSMDKTEPIIRGEFNVSVSLKDFNQDTEASISIFLKERSRDYTQELFSEVFSGSTYKNLLTFNIDRFKHGSGGSYEVLVEISTSRPRNNFFTEKLRVSQTSYSFSTPDEVQIHYQPLSSRLSFISNDIETNQVLVNYELSWNKNKAYEITGELLGIDERGIEQFRESLLEPQMLFSQFSGEQSFVTGLELGEILPGDVWIIESGRLLNEKIENTKKGKIKDNVFQFKMIMRLKVRELFRDEPTSTTPNSEIESWSSHSLEQTYICNTHEPPYYSYGAGFTFERAGGQD